MKVAIVDDDESVCRAIVRLLRLSGMSPSVFASGAELLSSPPQQFGCLLLDIQLGEGMSGLELHRRLIDQGDRTPVIYLTASDDPATEAAARSMGCAAFILKGGPPDLMLKALLRIQQGHSLSTTGRAARGV